MNGRMRPRLIRRLPARIVAGAALALCLLAADPAILAQGARNSNHWVGTWATAVVARPQAPPAPAGQGGGQAPQGQAAPAPQGGGRGAAPPLNFNNQTLRQVVHTSIGGTRARVVLSNAFGTAPLPIGSAHIALREKGSAIVANSDRALTFSGSASTTIPAGAVVFSDPVNLTVPPLADLAIDVYLPGDTAASTSPLTTHNGALQTNYVSQTGNHAGKPDLPVMTTTAAWFFLARVEVTAPAQVGTLVAFGDSITDGTRSTVDTNNRWPDHLARRLMAPSSTVKMGVLNEGIAGNRVLADLGGQSALARFDRDVLVQPSVTHVVVMDGINDLGRDANLDVADLIAGHKQLIERAHGRGIKIYAGTLTPVDGTTGNLASYSTAENQTKRMKLNEWIRTSKAYDGVIDFDAALRDPNNPKKVQAQWLSEDNLHPNDAGYQAMAAAIDLALFRAGQGGQVPTRTAAK